MTTETIGKDRRIVTCDDCGTPFVAVIEREQLRLIGPQEPECPNCGGETFSRLSL